MRHYLIFQLPQSNGMYNIPRNIGFVNDVLHNFNKILIFYFFLGYGFVSSVKPTK